MANININSNYGLKRYSTDQHTIALMRGEKEANRLINLEALYVRGFVFDEMKNCYTNGQIEITQKMLEVKDVYMEIDIQMQELIKN